MQTIAINLQAQNISETQSGSLSQWLQKVIILSEENRFGVTATLILLQITIAGFNVVIPPMIGASAYLMAPGIFMAFLSNSLGVAQLKMKWVLLGFASSMIINAAVSIYCFAKL